MYIPTYNRTRLCASFPAPRFVENDVTQIHDLDGCLRIHICRRSEGYYLNYSPPRLSIYCQIENSTRHTRFTLYTSPCVCIIYKGGRLLLSAHDDFQFHASNSGAVLYGQVVCLVGVL